MIKIIQTLENIVTVTCENFELKKMLENYEGDSNPTSSQAVSQAIAQNVIVKKIPLPPKKKKYNINYNNNLIILII